MEFLTSNDKKYELSNKVKNVKIFGVGNNSIQEEFESFE